MIQTVPVSGVTGIADRIGSTSRLAASDGDGHPNPFSRLIELPIRAEELDRILQVQKRTTRPVGAGARALLS